MSLLEDGTDVDHRVEVRTGRKLGLIDYEKMFCPDPNTDDIFDKTGCMDVVRPDQYVAHVLPLHGYDGLADFFAGVLIDAEWGSTPCCLIGAMAIATPHLNLPLSILLASANQHRS